jgi:hypothetical protein
LRQDLGVWALTFAGREAGLRHEQGLYYVAYLLTHPPQEPLHGLAVALRALTLYDPRQLAAEEVPSALTQGVTPRIDAPLQERSLGLEHANEAWLVRRKQLELEAIVDDEDQIEPVRSEAQFELIDIYEYQKHNQKRTMDAAQRAVRAVRMAIRRLHEGLANAVDPSGRPHGVLRPFAEHLEKHLLLPSARYSEHKRLSARAGLAGCFTYERPPGVVWVG